MFLDRHIPRLTVFMKTVTGSTVWSWAPTKYALLLSSSNYDAPRMRIISA